MELQVATFRQYNIIIKQSISIDANFNRPVKV